MSEPATAPAPAGVLGQRQAMARRGGWLPWSSVRNLIIFGFALLALALAFVTIAGAYQTTRHRAELEQLEFHSTRASLIQNVETQASIAGLLLQRYVEAGGDTYPAEINQHAAAAQVSLEQVLNMGNAPPGFADVTSTGLQLMRDAARTAELRRIGNLDLARQVLEEIVPIFRGYRLTLEDLTARDLAEVSNLRARANDAGQLTLWVLVASGGFGLVFAFAVALFITRSIAGPLGALENAALAVSYGDLNARSNVTQPRELAHLSQLINAMVAAVQERTQELEDRNRQLLDARALASTDGLTGVLNHRAFQERIRALVAAASKTAPVSLIIVDLDGFKQINDRLGHQKGDEILRLCTEACVRIVGSDAVYRYGGDEIAVVAEAADLDEAGRIAENIRSAIVEEGTEAANVTVSLGVASYPLTASSADELTYQADAAMYTAKSTGKNRVCRWGEIAAAPPPVPDFLRHERRSLTLAALADAFGVSEENVLSEIHRVLRDRAAGIQPKTFGARSQADDSDEPAGPSELTSNPARDASPGGQVKEIHPRGRGLRPI